MVICKNILVALFVLSVNGVGKAVTPKLHLTVYYESNCRDSRSFVKQQLLPVMRRLPGLVSTLFVPFGKATSTDYGSVEFECQHGPSECLGNMVQDCVLDSMRDRSDWDKTMYVACEMDTYAASMGSYECVEKAQVPVKRVKYCVAGGRGAALQMNSEHLTNHVPNVRRFVPTITVNGIFDERVQESAMRDLFGTVCAFIPHTPACAEHHNLLALKRIMDGRESYSTYSFTPSFNYPSVPSYLYNSV